MGGIQTSQRASWTGCRVARTFPASLLYHIYNTNCIDIVRTNSYKSPFASAYLLMVKALEKTAPLNIRVKAPQRALIEQAASAAEMTVSDFVRDAVLLQAKNALLDRTNIALNEQEWAAFVEALDAPPASNPRLRDLMSRKAPWEQ